MIVVPILILAILLQLIAAIMALRLAPFNGKRIVWVLIALALMLMALRRIIPIIHVLAGDTKFQPYINAEIIALMISLLLVVGISGIAPLLKARKRAEEEMAQIAREWQETFDAVNDSIWILDKDQHVIRSNRTSERMFRHPPEELIGKHCWEIVHGTKQPVPECPTLRAKISLQRETMELQIASSWFEVSADPILNGEGELTGFVHIVSDITDHKHAEEKLRESERRYRQLIEQAPEGVTLHEADGRFILVNSKLCEMLGYTEEELLRLNILDTYPDELREQGEKRLSYLKSGDIIRIERPMKRKDSSVFYIEASASKLPDGRIQGIIQDITLRRQVEEERKVLETQLIQAQKMDSIGRLAGGIAHDFNNILSAIIGYSELALCDASNPEKITSEIKEVLKAGGRAKDLVGQILTFSRRKEVAYSPISMKTVIKESLKMLRSVIPTTIEIRQYILDAGMVMADPSQINQIIMNLCTNAAQAMDESGGVIGVILSKMIIDDKTASSLGLAPGPHMRFSVSDTGKGIPPDMIERIFEPYFTTKELGRGTGLGLSVVHGIVKSHKGTIICSSEPHKGTTFDVYLPEIESIMGASTACEDMDYLPGRERILFIDDEPTLANMAKIMLNHLGYSVVIKTSSIEALELFRKEPKAFDLVITDMTMPEMRGDRLACEIMKIRDGMPIILCTGYSEHISEETAKAMGIQEYVAKPIEMRVLANIIRKVLDK